MLHKAAEYEFQLDQMLAQVVRDQLQDQVNYFIDLFLKDKDFMKELTFGWMKQHDYPYLILCVWECYKRQNTDISKSCIQTNHDVQSRDALLYAFHVAIALNRPDIIEGLILKEWSHLDINKCVSALPVAVYNGHEELVKYLLTLEKLDINAHYKGVSALHVAVYSGHEELVKYLLTSEKLDINVCIEKPDNWEKNGEDMSKELQSQTNDKNMMWKELQSKTGRTALHLATEHGYVNLVQLLCCGKHIHGESIKCHEEDVHDITPIDIVNEQLKPEKPCYRHKTQKCKTCYPFYKAIEKVLMTMEDVRKGIEDSHSIRQVHVDAANTILVGAALIAGVTFAGWLQPPLGFVQYYEFPTPPPAPPGTYNSYIGIEQHVGIQVFSIFNSLSFFFAIATIIVGADAAFPMHQSTYIGEVSKTMKLLLRRAIKLLLISLVCVLGAFGSAAVVILPPHVYFRKHLVLTIVIGSCVCTIVLWQLLTRHSTTVQMFNTYIIHIISKYTNIFNEPTFFYDPKSKME